MNPINFLKRKLLEFLVPFIEGSKKKEKRKKEKKRNNNNG